MRLLACLVGGSVRTLPRPRSSSRHGERVGEGGREGRERGRDPPPPPVQTRPPALSPTHPPAAPAPRGAGRREVDEGQGDGGAVW
ncbi:hypothetical protein EG872_16100 [Enterococcus faecalis]|nr:hypothetical protein EG872_16100 [Enterococcus faecalis]RXF42303.1 hypothetical protein EG864_15120 [Enterococcus faecalis]